MGARVYDPYTGTFTQPDPVQGGGANAYGYTNGDPVNETDLDGRSFEYENPQEEIAEGVRGDGQEGEFTVAGGGVEIDAHDEGTIGDATRDATDTSLFTRHGLNRVIGDGDTRAGVTPAALLDTLNNPDTVTDGIDEKGRPYIELRTANARVIKNPQGRIVSANPLRGAGANR
jgi:hypothetical protein